MILLGNLRASSAPWLILPTLLYLGTYVGGENFWGVPGYGPASGELAAWGVTVIVPTVAGAAAWEAGRQRRLGDIRRVGARSAVGQWLWAARPVFALHVVLVAGALVTAGLEVGAWPSGAGLLAVGHLLVLPLGWMVIGWVVGLLCPRAVAAPAAAVGSWVWLAVPHSMSSPAWRHLGGFVIEGSTLTDILDPLVFLVPWLVTAGFATAAVLTTGVRRRPWLPAVSAAIVVGTLVGGRSLVADWGFSPLTAARVGHTVCVGKAPAVCVPEEYESEAASLRRDSLPALKALQAAGLPMPRTLRMASDDLALKPGTWPLYWSPENPTGQLDIGLARSAVTGVAALTGVRDCRRPSIADTWALLAVGTDERKVRETVPDQEWVQLQRIRELPAAQQTDWFTKTVQDQTHCVAGLT
ncbi:hypothetical protein OG909_13380 [Streptomyces sp. NBC_01754]|uniref:DUF7224 domain-containing protein n=1 Tax=Streptomyces sp. NBC_01754 TaxID=2975930 RepID=UPI002DD85343|nr:hypothetical protein [Streptomyces sp. NBC_01754]WSC93202.1 hypothetical protein OG909_13380 [Streptomyces sp. NBC_01754]